MNLNTVIYSPSDDPRLNLSVEEQILATLQAGQVFLLLYVNRPSIISGRYQNPWRECRVDMLKKNDIMFARRVSGGGTVYHDHGNLNYSFIMDRNLYDTGRQFSVILNALSALGVKAEISGKSNITVNDRKISGNAFTLKRERALHHGTLLVSSDLTRLNGILKPAPGKIDGKGILSIPASVVNLNSLNPEITISKMREALRAAFTSEYGSAVFKNSIEEYRNPEICGRHLTPEWQFGQTPDFSIELEVSLQGQTYLLTFLVVKGRIAALYFFDQPPGMDIPLLEKHLSGIPFDSGEIAVGISEISAESGTKELFRDLANWFKENLF